MYYKVIGEVTIDYRNFEKITIDGETAYIKLRQPMTVPENWTRITGQEFIERQEDMLKVVLTAE